MNSVQVWARKIGSRVLNGVVLSCTAILSLAFFLLALHTYMIQIPNGFAIEMFGYGLIFVFSLTGLYFLVSGDKTKQISSDESNSRSIYADLPALAFSFLGGIIMGFKSASRARQSVLPISNAKTLQFRKFRN